jgi:hypothetical protein
LTTHSSLPGRWSTTHQGVVTARAFRSTLRMIGSSGQPKAAEPIECRSVVVVTTTSHFDSSAVGTEPATFSVAFFSLPASERLSTLCFVYCSLSRSLALCVCVWGGGGGGIFFL